MTTLTLDVQKIRDAAATSPEARKALEVLAPEAFEPEVVRVKTEDEDLAGYRDFRDAARRVMGGYMAPRNCGSLKGQGLFLDQAYSWSIEVDDEGVQVLVARKSVC